MKKGFYLFALLGLLVPQVRAQLSVGGTATLYVGSGGTLAVNGTLQNAGTLTNAGTVYLRGDLQNTATLTSTDGNLTLDGSAAQTLTSSSALSVKNLTVNNTAPGEAVTLAAPLTVGGVGTFTDGVLKTDATNRLTFADGATVSGAADASHVKGPVQKVGGGAFVFPLGNGTTYRPASVAPQSGQSTDAYAAAYQPADAGNTGTLPACARSVSNAEYWQVDRTAGSSAAVVGLAYQNVATTGTDSPDLRVARAVNSSWELLTCAANGGLSGGLVLTNGPTATFGRFTLGFYQVPTLTVTYPTLTALCAGQTVSVSVATLGEFGDGNTFTAQLSDANGMFGTLPAGSLGTVGVGTNTLTIPAGTPAGTGYQLRVVASNPATVSNASAAFTVLATTAIQSVTQSQSICPGQSFVATVQATGANLTYQWYRQLNTTTSQAIPGATAASVTLTSQYLPGTFFVAVSGTCGGAVNSPTFTLTYKQPTLLQVSSLVSSVCEGGNLTLSVRGSGPGNLTYAWRKDDPNGSVIGTGASYTLQNAQVNDAGTYYATVQGDCPGPTVSIPVSVRYLRITQQPQSVNLCSGQTTLTVGVQAVGVTPTYQWKRNGQNIVGATQSSYVVQANRPGTYTVEVKTACGSVLSQDAVVGCANGRLALEAVAEPSLTVAPNPVKAGAIHCRVRGFVNPEFSLVDATGRVRSLRSTGHEAPGEWTLHPSQPLTTGVYVLQAREGAVRLSQRVLVVE
jgi:hypothetical protein